MRICSNYYDVEEEVKRYYRNLDEKEILTRKLKLYNEHKSQIENDIKNSNITLNPDIKAISYELEKGNSIDICSPQEKEIERAFKRLEIELKMCKLNIINIKDELRKMEKSIAKMDYILNKFSQKSRKMIELLYKEKKTTKEIEIILNMDKSTIYRRRKKILNYIKSFYSSN